MNELKKGASVSVEFISESATQFSGKVFAGKGKIDRIEDGYVFGRLNDGTPFMCGEQDVKVINELKLMSFEETVKQLPEYKTLIFSYGDRLFIKRDGEYEVLAVRLAHKFYMDQQATIDELTGWVNDLRNERGTLQKICADRADEIDRMRNNAVDMNKDPDGNCRHFSTTLFNEGKAECFHCDAIVNEKREVIGRQEKRGLFSGIKR